MISTKNKIYSCFICNGYGLLYTSEYASSLLCGGCGGKKYLTWLEFKKQIIEHTSNNLKAIEVLQRYEPNRE